MEFNIITKWSWTKGPNNRSPALEFFGTSVSMQFQINNHPKVSYLWYDTLRDPAAKIVPIEAEKAKYIHWSLFLLSAAKTVNQAKMCTVY